MPIGTPITKHRRTEIRTDERVIIASVQILHAPMKTKRIAVIIANLIPTDFQLIRTNAPIVNQYGKYVR